MSDISFPKASVIDGAGRSPLRAGDPPFIGILGEPGGTGPFPAVVEVPADLPTHTSFHPAQGGGEPWPILLWGTNGCCNDGTGHADILKELASHGYYVISMGTAHEPDGTQTRTEAPVTVDTPSHAPEALREETWDMDATPPDTLSPMPEGCLPPSELTKALDWALAENERPDSWLHGKLDPSRVAAMGFSCGGLAAMTISTDPRIKTTLMWNSGILPLARMVGIDLTKEQLQRLHAPVLYILGGKSDEAYIPAMDDYRRITCQPVALVSRDFGHFGGFISENHVEYSKPGLAWLDWHLKGRTENKTLFVGPDCHFATRPGWSAMAKNFD